MAALIILLVGIVTFGLMIAVSAIFKGYALSVLWGWFMVPIFGLPKISIPAAIGIALVVSYLTYHDHENNCKKESEEESTGKKLAKGIIITVIRPLMALLIGWIVHKFM